MKIKDLAIMQNCTTQAVYKRLRAHGIEIKTICNADGNLSESGIQAVSEVFGIDREKLSNAAAALEVQKRKQEFPQNKEALANRIRELETRLTTAQETIDNLNKEIATLKEERDYLRQTLTAEQNLHALAMQLIPEPQKKLEDPKEKRHSVFFGLFQRGK